MSAKRSVKKPAKKRAKPAKKNEAALRRTPISEIAPEEQIIGATFLGKVRAFDAATGALALTLEAQLAVGESVRVKGRETDLTQRVERLHVGTQAVQSASPGEEILLVAADPVRVGDAVYKL